MDPTQPVPPVAPVAPVAPTTDPKQLNPLTGMPFTTEELTALLGTYGDQMQMTDQQAQAEALRSRPGAEGRSSGRVYTAANPLEVLGDIGYQYAAKRKSDRAGRLQKKIGRNVKKYGMGVLDDGGGSGSMTGDPETDALLGL